MNLSDFYQEFTNLGVQDIIKIQKKLGYLFPPDFLYFNINFGKVSHKKAMYSIDTIPFSRSVSLEDYDESIGYFHTILPTSFIGNYVVFMFSYDPNYFILMGARGSNRNMIFKYNDVLDSEPIFICNSIFELFEEIMKKED